MVREVTDQEILDAKAKVGAGGLGCEPASAASVAGDQQAASGGHHRRRRSRRLHPDRAISSRTRSPPSPITAPIRKPSHDVLGSRGVAEATFANRAVQVPNDLDEIIKAIESRTIV